jgi:hypothetical protein
MKTLLENFKKEHGYTPTYHELFDLYQQGYLSLTDKQENELLGLVTFNNDTSPELISNMIEDKNR